MVNASLPLMTATFSLGHDRPSEARELLVKARMAEATYVTATRFWLEPYQAPKEPVDPATGIPLKHIVRV
jgi:hypothetical protein